MPRSSAPARGFTLLEVLAAVAILGVWYVILAAVAVQGLQRQGESHRRLEASFIADDEIATIEAGLARGNAPKEGIDEREQDDFEVRVEVASFAIDVPEASISRSPPSSTLEPPLLVEVTDLLGGAGPLGEPGPLRSVRVQVSWTEGHDERYVIRSTYAFDLASITSELGAIAGALSQDSPDATPDAISELLDAAELELPGAQ